MAILFSFSNSLPMLSLLLLLLTQCIGVHAMGDGDIDCDDQEKVSALAMQAAIDSLLEKPDLMVCAFNDGNMKENFPVEWDLDRQDIKMPQDDLRTPDKGWTRAGVCTQPGNIHAGIWLQTYRWGAPHFCHTQKELADFAQRIKDKCTVENDDGVEVVRGTMQITYERWVEIGESDNCEDFSG